MEEAGEISTAIDPPDQLNFEWHLDIDVGNKFGRSSLDYIHRVPKNLRVDGEDICKYEPCIVSIGPYHRKQGMHVNDDHKKLYLCALLSRFGNENSQGGFNIMMKEIGQDAVRNAARNCYAESNDLTDEKFVEMLVMDGCFILELLFNQNWVVPYIRRDLVLLENQIPFIVLEHLVIALLAYETEQPTCPTDFTSTSKFLLKFIKTSPDIEPRTKIVRILNISVLHFFSPILPCTLIKYEDHTIRGEHILDYLRKQQLFYEASLLEPSRSVSRDNVGDRIFWGHTTCATDLQEAGVKFKRKESCRSLLDITFDEGVFEIPPFNFGVSWTVLIPNMIALEQCRGDYGDEITSYAMLMDDLINSHNDVKILRGKGIIDRFSKEDKEIAHSVNNLTKEAIVNNFYYDGLCSQVNAYRQGKFASWRADFMRKYIHTPWAGISVLAAAFLLLLTVAQTVFTIMSWKVSLG